VGTGLVRAFLFTAVFLSAVETTSPGLPVPEASTISLVLPDDGGLKGVGPDEVTARSQGFAGGPPAIINQLQRKLSIAEIMSQ